MQREGQGRTIVIKVCPTELLVRNLFLVPGPTHCLGLVYERSHGRCQYPLIEMATVTSAVSF